MGKWELIPASEVWPKLSAGGIVFAVVLDNDLFNRGLINLRFATVDKVADCINDERVKFFGEV